MAVFDREPRWLLVAATAVLVLLALISALGLVPYSVPGGHIALVLRGGEIVREEQAGLRFRIPIYEKIRTVPVERVFKAERSDIVVLTLDKARITASMTVMWRVCDARRFYVTTAADRFRARNYIIDVALDAMRALTRDDWTASAERKQAFGDGLARRIGARSGELGICILQVKVDGQK